MRCGVACVMAWQEYFGEKIALYFEFMGHYTSWLRYPALVGAPIQIYMLLANDYNTAPQVGDSCCSCTTVTLVAGLVNVLCCVVAGVVFCVPGDVGRGDAGVLEAAGEVQVHGVGHGGLRGDRAGPTRSDGEMHVLSLLACAN